MMKIIKEYTCDCGLNFGNKKDHWERHINRKYPCKALNKNMHQNAPKKHQNAPKKQKKIKNIIDDNMNALFLQETNELQCMLCLKIFSRKYCLNRHMNGRCKLKKEIDKSLIEEKSLNEKNVEEKNTEIDFIIKRLDQLENENKKLKKQINKTEYSKQTNINIDKQINNINVKIVNFNDLDYEEIDKRLFTNPLLNPRLHGKFIILQMIENVYINEAHPEYQNLIITDKNRGYVKIYNNGKWKTDNINTMNIVIDGIISHSKNILVELKQQFVNNSNAKNRLNTSEKYINLCDLEYLADLEDKQTNDDINNKDKIQRCKDFREMVYKDTINMSHDSKDILTKQKNLNEKIIEV